MAKSEIYLLVSESFCISKDGMRNNRHRLLRAFQRSPCGGLQVLIFGEVLRKLPDERVHKRGMIPDYLAESPILQGCDGGSVGMGVGWLVPRTTDDLGPKIAPSNFLRSAEVSDPINKLESLNVRRIIRPWSFPSHFTLPNDTIKINRQKTNMSPK